MKGISGKVWGGGGSSKGNNLNDKMKSPFSNASGGERSQGPRDGDAEKRQRRGERGFALLLPSAGALRPGSPWKSRQHSRIPRKGPELWS